MWADTILNAEREYIVRTLAWAGLSVVAATSVGVFLSARRLKSPVLVHFAVQLGGWGLVLGLIGALEWQGLHLRDLAGATRLERATWARVGFDVGVVGMGVALAATSRWYGRSLAAMGAAAGLAVQGVALLVLDLQFAAMVSR